jgi:hypothetical protein
MGYIAEKVGHNSDYLDGKLIFQDILLAMTSHKLAYGNLDQLVIAISIDARESMHEYLKTRACPAGDDYYPDEELQQLKGVEVRAVQLDQDVAWELWVRE